MPHACVCAPCVHCYRDMLEAMGHTNLTTVEFSQYGAVR
jgi:hypothetical protein